VSDTLFIQLTGNGLWDITGRGVMAAYTSTTTGNSKWAFF